ncbi:MAG: tetratricopeptide repeat protein [Chloroflexi bacterium]|nr:tetratricopeptide repeat protein [Chloroflexota bacterium]
MTEDQPYDTMFQDAMDALRRGDKPRAKDLLTRLLKTDQNNTTYWIWLSAAVDNKKERVYCLQTAYNIDPENGTAKRGLILLGALSPDESIQPFPMNRPRTWEEKLLLSSEKPKEKGFKALTRNPVTRLVTIVLILVGVFSAVIFGFVLPRQTFVAPTQSFTPGPSPTFTTTPTVWGATAAPTRPFSGPTPLWMMLPQTYTPTAVYVNTPRAAQSIDQYRSAKIAYQNGDWDSYIASMELIADLEPEAADVRYLIGEAYRFKGDVDNALDFYNEALKLDPDFGAPYLGLARVRLLDNPDVNVEYLFDEAIDRDPGFGEIYLERARYFLFHNNAKSAIKDLNEADKLLPNSPAVYMAFADAYLMLEDNRSALEAAQKAYSLDITDPLVYRTLGSLYIENGQYERAIEALNVYVVYAPTNDRAFALLGRAYYEMKDYKSAVENFDKAEELNRNSLRKSYIYRGLANLELGNIDQAVQDLENALSEDDKSFPVSLGLARAYFIQEKFGSTYLRADVLMSLAKTDEETALALYWRAMSQEKRGEAKLAVKDWQELLKMDEDAMTTEMRSDAETHLKAVVTPTNTAKPVTPTATKKGGATPTATATAKGGTATPTAKKGTVTPTVTITPTVGVIVPSLTPKP